MQFYKFNIKPTSQQRWIRDAKLGLSNNGIMGNSSNMKIHKYSIYDIGYTPSIRKKKKSIWEWVASPLPHRPI